MRILVIGEKPLFQELAKKIGDEHTLDHITTVNEIEDFPTIDVAVDFTADESIDHVEYLVTLDHLGGRRGVPHLVHRDTCAINWAIDHGFCI